MKKHLLCDQNHVKHFSTRGFLLKDYLTGQQKQREIHYRHSSSNNLDVSWQTVEQHTGAISTGMHILL